MIEELSQDDILIVGGADGEETIFEWLDPDWWKNGRKID